MDMDECNKNQKVPSNSMGSRQRLGLSLVLFPMKHLSVQVVELHFIIVQQAKAPCNIGNKLFQQTSDHRAQTMNSHSVTTLLINAVYSSSPLKFKNGDRITSTLFE